MARAAPDALFPALPPAGPRARKYRPTSSTARQSVVWDEAENRLHVQKAPDRILLLGRIAATGKRIN